MFAYIFFAWSFFRLFQIENCRVFLAKDGTEIQDETYFTTIEPQTLFVIATDVHLVKTGTNNQFHCHPNLDLAHHCLTIPRFFL